MSTTHQSQDVSSLEYIDLRDAGASARGSTGRLGVRGRLPRPATWVTWGALAVFVAVQVALITQERTGPFIDEGIYVVAGLRTLQGEGLNDAYLAWFAGSLAWPTLAGLGYHLAGLVGVRLIALACVTAGVAGTLQATATLYGRQARMWAALALLPWGPLLALGHLGVYDALAVTGIGCSLWAVTQLADREHRRWLLTTVAFLLLAILAKYPAAFLAPFIVGLLIALRGRRSMIDVVLLTLASGGALLAFFLPLREQLSEFVAWRVVNDPSFDTSAAAVTLTVVLSIAAPVVVAFAGATIAPRTRVAVPLLAGALLFPAYHVLRANSVGATKHVVFGVLLITPLIGLALSRTARRPVGAVLTGLALTAWAVTGGIHLDLLDRGWADVRPVRAYLEEHMKPGDVLLAPTSWPYAASLYAKGVLTSPWDVYDVYRVDNGELRRPICEVEWFLEEEFGLSWNEDVRSALDECESFRPVFRAASPVTNIGNELDFVSYSVTTTVWKNTAIPREAARSSEDEGASRPEPDEGAPLARPSASDKGEEVVATATIRLEPLVQGLAEDGTRLVRGLAVQEQRRLAESAEVADLARDLLPGKQRRRALPHVDVRVVGDNALELRVAASSREAATAEAVARAWAAAYLDVRADRALVTLRDVGEDVVDPYLDASPDLRSVEAALDELQEETGTQDLAEGMRLRDRRAELIAEMSRREQQLETLRDTVEHLLDATATLRTRTKASSTSEDEPTAGQTP